MSKADIFSYISGILFGVAWWVLADAAAYAAHTDDPQKVTFVFLLPGFAATIGLIMFNLLDWSKINEDISISGESTGTKAKCWMFLSFSFLFGAVFGALVILIFAYTNKNSKANSPYGGIAILVQTVLIVVSATLWRFVRANNEQNDY